MEEKLNLYENLFFHLYTSTSRVNRSIPDWSTTIFLAASTTLYIISLAILSPVDIAIIGRKGFMLIMIIGIFMHWLFFLRNDRILKKLKRVKPKSSIIGQILTTLYTFGGFALFFYSIGMRHWTYYFFIIIVFGLVELSTYIFGGEPIRFD